MAVTNNLKLQVDLPVWEWCRFAPTPTTAVSSLTTGNTLNNRYLYYQVSTSLCRYDTITDSWHQLTNMTGFSTPTIMNNNVLTNSIGHPGQAIGDGGGNDTIQLAGLSGEALVGYKIRIIDGTGAGQERTITNVSAPTIHERGTVTTAGTQSIVDANTGAGLKQWKINEWKNYQFRATYGTGRTQLRPILYNSINSLVWSDPAHITINAWANPLMNISVAVSTQFVIESHIATVDTNWTVKPDSTSQFMIMSGGIWNVTQGTTSAPFFSLSYYDILADQWYGKTTSSQLRTAVNFAGSDLSMERFTENGGAVVASTAVASAAARSLTTAATMVENQYKNFQIRIVSGLGIGQYRLILSNNVNKFNLARDWDTNPDNTSRYEVWRDVGKLFLVGGNYADLLQYSTMRDQWTPGTQFDDGQVQHLAVKRTGQDPIAITSITRTATSLKTPGSVTTAGANYNINDILTVATGVTYRVTGVDAIGGVTSVEMMTVGSGVTVGAKATTVTPTGGVGCIITVGAGDIDFSELAVTVINHNLKVGESVTIVGATSTGAAKFNGTYTILGTPSNTQFSYCSVGDPGAATATVAGTISTTVLFDAAKNWVINEHAGKLVQFTSNALLSTGQTRRIISNTANSLTWTLAATAATPVNGTYRYVIHDIKPFGVSTSNAGRIGGGIEGFATSGTTTTLVDTTKNWEVNSWAKVVGRKVRIVEGTGVGNELTIISNTANTLTFATQAFTVDTTSRYVIMDTFGTVSAAGAISTIPAAPTVAGTGYAVGDRLTVNGGTAVVQVMVAAGGVPSVLRLVDGGTGGYTAVATATTPITGTGVNLTVTPVITVAASTTVMQDNSKNWDNNAWVGKRVRFLSGTSQGNEYAITANTFNTITTAVGTSPDSSTAYAILDATPKAYGLHIDNITGCTDTSINHKYLYSFVGTGTVEMERYDITTEKWEKMSYFPQFETMTTGAMYCYDGADRIYIHLSTTLGMSGRLMYYDLVKNIMVPSTTIPYGHSTLVSGNRMEIIQTVDGLKYLYVMRQSAQEMWRILIYW
ncbi:MAG: hypothetical protein WCQ49_02375 [Candidatus Saccharibacteria bacterium]